MWLVPWPLTLKTKGRLVWIQLALQRYRFRAALCMDVLFSICRPSQQISLSEAARLACVGTYRMRSNADNINVCMVQVMRIVPTIAFCY